MKKLRFTAMLAATAILAGICSGCGAKEERAANETIITFWSCSGHAKDAYEKEINNYNKGEGAQKGIKIEYTYVSAETYNQTLSLALQNDTAPDIMEAIDVRKNVENGKYAPLEDLPGGEELVKKYDEYKKENVTTFDGKTYILPRTSTTMGLIYNTKMFEEAGIVDENGKAKPPVTFDELFECAKKLTDANNKKYGIILPRKWSGWAESDILYTSVPSCGYMRYDYKTGKVNLDTTKTAIQCYKDIEENGYCFPGSLGIDNDAARAYFAEGNIGMKIAFSFDVGVLRDQFPAKIDWEVAPLPVVDKDNTYKQRLTYGYTPAISKTAAETKDGEKLMEAYKFLAGDELLKTFYKEGLEIPYSSNVTEGIELDDSMKQWKAFCDMVDISTDLPSEPSKDSSAMMKYQDRVNLMMSGEQTIEEGIKVQTEEITKAIEDFYKNNPDSEKKLEDYIVPDWDARR